MIYKHFSSFYRLASALRQLSAGTTRAPMHGQAPMYESNVFSDDIGIPIGFAYDIQDFLPFGPFGFCLTALVWQSAHASPDVNVQILAPWGRKA